MSKFTNRADLLIAAGESIKMQEKYGIEPMHKYDNRIVHIIFDGKFHLGSVVDRNEFPLSVVEGKPAFVGDELYYGDSGLQTFITDKMFPEKWSWLPPKPKTISIDIPRPVVCQASGKSNCWLDIRFESSGDRDVAQSIISKLLESK